MQPMQTNCPVGKVFANSAHKWNTQYNDFAGQLALQQSNHQHLFCKISNVLILFLLDIALQVQEIQDFAWPTEI